MKQGYLSTYFTGIAVKRLSAVEIMPNISNQHELNGVAQLKDIFGINKRTFQVRFIYLGEKEEDYATDAGFLTWYDARERHPTRTEHRLYYPTTSVSESANEGDLLVIGILPDGTALVIIAEAGSKYEKNLIWLFNLPGEDMTMFAVKDVETKDDAALDFASRMILDEIGIESVETDENYLEAMIDRFGRRFPSTRIFSEYARHTLTEVSASSNPDEALVTWMEREEVLFRTLERHIIGERVSEGFQDVDTFISYSLSVQNRRKSRAGHALDPHAAQVFKDNSVRYSRGRETENRSKPDFVFPSIEDYHNPDFLSGNLTMLGVKSTCKDRWRQVLSEAARIDNKHLLTLEPGITENQTAEMQANRLQLVLPRNLHETYSVAQKAWLMDITDFIVLVRHRQ